ncbi:MAG: tRNA pseudouridine(55) synthase TruB [Clostridia bacterium]|nr:tRNA pseudouridine(55) synthase TruB [Clostridia bacterium]
MDNINGIVIVNKDKGFTSHDVVNVIRKIFGTRKVGHTGTLDPDATGVLPICIGKGTKLADMLTFSDKCYKARVRLGITTDTQDISGEILTKSDVNVTEEELLLAIKKHTGEIMQIPPMYSAIKINGQKLCDLARKGIEVERKPRKVTIYSAELSDFDGMEFNLTVSCSKGTYIRTLCDDIGKHLGCGAVMTELQRTKSSVFTLENSYTLDELKQMTEDKLRSILMPVDSVFLNYPEMYIDDNLKKRVTNGATSFVKLNEGTYRIYDKEKNFLCLAQVKEENGKKTLKSIKTFY